VDSKGIVKVLRLLLVLFPITTGGAFILLVLNRKRLARDEELDGCSITNPNAGGPGYSVRSKIVP
jgi:hypothetical protein